MSTEKKQLEKCRKLYEALRETQAKGYTIMEELGAVLNGAEGIGDKMKRLEAKFSLLWSARYQSAYVWSYMRDRPQMKRLLAAMAEDDIGRRMENYLIDGEKYLTAARHPFALFVTQINRYADVGRATTQDFDLEAPADCAHTPSCRSEQEHTRRQSADLRR